ncbi:hypothetical protein [Burkholderia cepacia]|uniref:hypothetical protein n=1 Tax=Burkholderia cepacia TaxID=292 RepID=UPI000B120655|nr:hypothetical protein [Burkholderia cepacia]
MQATIKSHGLRAEASDRSTSLTVRSSRFIVPGLIMQNSSKPGHIINNTMIRKYLHTTLLLTLPALMSACVLPGSVEMRDSTVDGKFGYIASAARSKYGNGYVLYVENVDSKEERTFQLIEAYPINRVFDDVNTPPHINMIKVPPGTYALTGWAAYGWGFHDKNAGRKFDPQSTIAEPFPVAPGSVVFLGDFVTDNHVASVLTMKYQIIPQSIDIDSARNEFINAYPAFKDAIFICKLCSLNNNPEKRRYNFVKP